MSWSYDITKIRNLAIIAHIDHGKSTLADRLLEFTKTVQKRDMKEQLLDDMDLERERGITIKAHPVTMYYATADTIYQINLIDTPGHVDFSYEVSRSLAACESALLIIDGSQGIQAQTIANVRLATEKELHILPIINKIDLPSSNPENVKKQIKELLHLNPQSSILASAKTGTGVAEILEEIVYSFPPPQNAYADALTRALIFDSDYDKYRGVMIYVRIISGCCTKKNIIRLMSTKKDFEVQEVGLFSPTKKPTSILQSGEVGYILANIKNPSDVKIGDTITFAQHPAPEPLPGLKKAAAFVFATIYPVETSDFLLLKDAFNKLRLNDSALTVEFESSALLGSGFRCGFLGLLHLEIIFERLQREFSLDILTTTPSVEYKIHFINGTICALETPSQFPNPEKISYIEEPIMTCNILTPSKYIGAVLSLINGKRGNLTYTETIDDGTVFLHATIPLNEIITDFHDNLKSITQGYASFDYEPHGYQKSKIIKLDIHINEKPIDAFAFLIHQSKAETYGRSICKKLVELIPKKHFKIPVQSVIGGKIIARETVPALTKNVTAKCYGGDITRKRKLWEKQKEGKKKMKEFGNVSIPQEAFIAVLKTNY